MKYEKDPVFVPWSQGGALKGSLGGGVLPRP